MRTLRSSYPAIELVESHRNYIHTRAESAALARIKLPSLSMLYLLRDICTLTLSVEEYGEHRLHHIVEDPDDLILVRHSTALIESIKHISRFINADIDLQLSSSTTNPGILIPEPLSRRETSDVGGVLVPGSSFMDYLYEGACGNLHPSRNLQDLIGSILTLQSLIEESPGKAFVLTMVGMRNVVGFEYFDRTMKAMESAIHTIGKMNGVSIGVDYYIYP